MLPVWPSAVLVSYPDTISPRQLAPKERGSGHDSGDRSAGLQRRDSGKRISDVPDLSSTKKMSPSEYEKYQPSLDDPNYGIPR